MQPYTNHTANVFAKYITRARTHKHSHSIQQVYTHLTLYIHTHTKNIINYLILFFVLFWTSVALLNIQSFCTAHDLIARFYRRMCAHYKSIIVVQINHYIITRCSQFVLIYCSSSHDTNTTHKTTFFNSIVLYTHNVLKRWIKTIERWNAKCFSLV